DERTEELVRRPALGSGRHEQLWRELADRAELEPLESGGEVGRQRCGGAAHWRSSTAYAASGRTGTAGTSITSRSPGSVRRATPGPAARIARTSAARKRRWAIARSSAATRTARPWAR